MSDDPYRSNCVGDRYVARFGADAHVSDWIWSRDYTELDALMERAIEAGVPLSEDDLLRAQGLERPPAGVPY